jgi:Tetratricopeptide repeat
MAEAIPLYRGALADCERVRGTDHPSTLRSRNNLAMAYRAAGRTAEAIPLLERTLTDRERMLGADHLDTNAARKDLAALTGKLKRHRRVRSRLLYRLTWESERPRVTVSSRRRLVDRARSGHAAHPPGWRRHAAGSWTLLARSDQLGH